MPSTYVKKDGTVRVYYQKKGYTAHTGSTKEKLIEKVNEKVRGMKMKDIKALLEILE